MTDNFQYKCPNCGGAIEFDSTVQKPKCPYCDTEFEPETLRAYDDDLNSIGSDSENWEESQKSEWQDGEADNLRVYVCNSCGGEIVCDNTTSATHCPYCDNPVILKGQLAGDLRPDLVIPFKFDKNSAKEALNNHLKGKRLLPKLFKDQNHIDEIKGVYVPFWLFDATADADVRYRATRVRSYSTPTHNCVETRYYSVTRAGTLSFTHVPVDGSTKMADDLMESIEPFDISEAVDFQTAYLSGYLADRYDVDEENSRTRAAARMKQSAIEAMRQTVVGYSSVTPEQSAVRIDNGHAKYVLYPVWLLNTTWNDQRYTFAMNAQTGKFVGNLPVDKGLFAKYLLGGTALFTAIAYGLLWLLENM